MSRHGTLATHEVLSGSARVFVAESIALPAGLITAAFLARRLGPDGFGVFTLATAIVTWLEWTLATLFTRASVKVVADATDWRPAAAVVLRTYAATGVVTFALLWIVAGAVASIMHEPLLARYLRVLALDVPLFMVIQAHHQVLVGTGQYARRAALSACRWIARMVLVLALVGGGLSIDGALAGIIGASAIELIVARRFVRPSLAGGTAGDVRTLWSYALPLFVAAISVRLFDKLDLFVLKALGGSAALAGVYGAAQNLAIIPGLISLSITPLLVSTLSRALRSSSDEGARALATNSMRGVLVLLPFAGVAAGAATGVSTLIYGAEFAATGPLLGVLIFAAIAVVMISVASSILTAGGRPHWAMLVALPVAPLALAGHLAAIPRFGATGAATVTLSVAVIGALVAIVAVHRAWNVSPPLATVARALVVTLVVAVAGGAWRTSGAMVVVELGAMSILAAGLLVMLGELTRAERQRVVAVLTRSAPMDTLGTQSKS